MLTALSKGLKGDSECISYDDIKQLLGGLASTLSDVKDLSIKALARCALARRHLYLDSIHSFDRNTRNELLKLPPTGSLLFNDKFQEIAHKSSELISDVWETTRNLGFNPGRQEQGSFKRHNPATSTASDDNKGASDRKYRRLDVNKPGVSGFNGNCQNGPNNLNRNKQGPSYNKDKKGNRGNMPVKELSGFRRGGGIQNPNP